jgi:predicted AlkP superfamily pyrophosphatase or phosphodiesterase
MKKHLVIAAWVLLGISPWTAATQDPATTPAPATVVKRVVVVSIDGLRPDFYLDPASHGIELPTMSRMMREGVYAEGVEPVFPSVTYPAHTSIVTGVRPSRHGIWNNYLFNPTGIFTDWYWEASAIEARTLWDAVRDAGGTSAAVSWPVTVGASIDQNFPEVGSWARNEAWRFRMEKEATPSFFAAIEETVGQIPEQAPEDEALEALVFQISSVALQRFRPNLLLIHVINTDSQQHAFGREHEEVSRAFQTTDRRLGELLSAVESLGLTQETLIVVTGDHGFIQTHSAIHMNAALREAGFLSLAEDGSVADWTAMAWPASGSAFLVLHDPQDDATRVRLEAFVDEMLAGPMGGVMRKVTRDELDRLGAVPSAVLALEGMEGYLFGGRLSGDVITPSGNFGSHGFLPDREKMKTGFLMIGPGVRAGVRIPVMRQIDIAPTIARWAGWEMPGTDGIALAGLFERE